MAKGAGGRVVQVLTSWTRRAGGESQEPRLLGHEIATNLPGLYVGRSSGPLTIPFSHEGCPREYQVLRTAHGPQAYFQVLSQGAGHPTLLGSGPGAMGYRGVTDVNLTDLVNDWSNWLGAAVAGDLGIDAGDVGLEP